MYVMIRDPIIHTWPDFLLITYPPSPPPRSPLSIPSWSSKLYYFLQWPQGLLRTPKVSSRSLYTTYTTYLLWTERRGHCAAVYVVHGKLRSILSITMRSFCYPSAFLYNSAQWVNAPDLRSKGHQIKPHRWHSRFVSLVILKTCLFSSPKTIVSNVTPYNKTSTTILYIRKMYAQLT